MSAALDALLRAAVDATGAAAGCLFAWDGTDLAAVAGAGDGGPALVGRRLAAGDTSAGFVVSSGQPIAVSGRSGGGRRSAVGSLLERDAMSVLCVPCTSDEGTVGALELIDKAGAPFSIDDVELATLLAGVAGAALADTDGRHPAVADPSVLGADLARLAAEDPARYRAVAGMVAILLDRG